MKKYLQTLLERKCICLFCSSEDLENSLNSNSLVWLSGAEDDFITVGDIMCYLLKKEKQYYTDILICSECTKNAISSYKFILKCESNEKAINKLVIGLTKIAEITKTNVTNIDKVAFMQIDSQNGKFNAFCDTQVATNSLSATLNRFQSITEAQGPDKNTEYDEEMIEDTSDNEESESSSDYDPDEEYCKPSRLPKKFKCYLCSKSFRYKESLEFHTDSNHRPKTVPCGKCDRHFGSQKVLNVHIRRSHVQEPCYICGKILMSRNNMRDHIESHSMNLQCERCLKKFTSNMAFLKHKRRDNCNKPFSERQKYNCNECTSKFSNENSLKKHIDFKHRGIAAFICEICSTKCQNKSGLENHKQRFHTNERSSYHCSFCMTSYLTKNYLQAHIRREHTHELSHKCYYCDEKFYGNTTRWSHMQRVHREKTVACDKCDAKFVIPSQLRTHKKHNKSCQ